MTYTHTHTHACTRSCNVCNGNRFCCFYDFCIKFWNYYDCVIYFVFSFYYFMFKYIRLIDYHLTLNEQYCSYINHENKLTINKSYR